MVAGPSARKCRAVLVQSIRKTGVKGEQVREKTSRRETGNGTNKAGDGAVVTRQRRCQQLNWRPQWAGPEGCEVRDRLYRCSAVRRWALGDIRALYLSRSFCLVDLGLINCNPMDLKPKMSLSSKIRWRCDGGGFAQ